MIQFVSFIIALSKTLSVLREFLDLLVAGYIIHKNKANAQDESYKNNRDFALIDAAAQQLHLCETCPFASAGRGQHGQVDSSPTVPTGGGSST